MGNARASTWDKREVEQPTSFRITLITLNLGSWRQKGKGITMNTINGMTFYDALTKFIIGFLITFLWLPGIINSGSSNCSCGVSLNAVQTFLYGILCFIAGFVWEAVYDLCGFCLKDKDKKVDNNTKVKQDIEQESGCSIFFHDLGIFLSGDIRNNEEWIERAKNKVEKEWKQNTIVYHNYYKAYYKNVNAPIGCVKTLEAHEAFLRYMIFILPLIYPIALLARCICGKKVININFLPEHLNCCEVIMIFFVCIFIDVFLFGIWRKIQFKIHELVWEAYYYN